MCNYPAPKQYAYIDPAGKFQRLGARIDNKEQMESCRRMIHSKAAYESVYGWKGWHGGKINAEISKTAVIDGIFLDFDDAEEPQKAIRDAAEVAAYVGHCTCNFSGAKGAHVLIHCHAVDLIPDLKGHVIRQFVNNLVDVSPELDTLDFAVVGDTSRVRRIIDSVHPGTKLHAIGLTIEELSALTIDEIKSMAANRRGLIQVPEPSQWITDELYRIEEEIIIGRFYKLHTEHMISESMVVDMMCGLCFPIQRASVYATLQIFEEEAHQIKAKQNINLRGEIIGSTREETWLIHAVREFKATGRAATGSRKSEHKARVHLAKLADECSWTLGEICDIYSGADDYDAGITERMVRSCIGRR